MTAQRQAGLRVWIDGEAIHDPTSWILSCAVEERADEASTFELMVDMSPIDGDWDVLEHGTFADENEVPNFALLNRVTIALSVTGDDGQDLSATVLEGFVTELEPVFGEDRVPDSHLMVRGMDASCLLHLEAITK